MTRSPPSATNSSTTSRLISGAAVNPPRQLTPNSQVSNRSVSETRTRSPHRPTRSIGSSWGFSGVEQDKKNDDHDEDDDEDEDEDKDDDTTDSDEDEEPKNVTKKTNGSSSSSTGMNGGTTATTSNPRVAKGKSPTVEELVEDPD